MRDVIEGELPPRRRPIIPGHQIVGRVVALGDRVTADLLGRRVGIAWLHRTCGACRFCGSARKNVIGHRALRLTDLDGRGWSSAKLGVQAYPLSRLGDALCDLKLDAVRGAAVIDVAVDPTAERDP